MHKGLVFIGVSAKGFMMDATRKALEERGIYVRNLEATMDAVKECEEEVPLVMIQGDELWGQNLELLQYIRHVCYQRNMEVVLYGDKNELVLLQRAFPSNMIASIYQRPINVQEVALHVDQLLDKIIRNLELSKVLVIDDSGPMLRTVMGWLEGFYSVQLANSASSGLLAVKKDKPDLILLDYEMPVCSGAEVFKILQSDKDTKDIPVIFLTSRGDPVTVREVLSLKPDGYLLKTTSRTAVIAAIEECLDKRRFGAV